MDIDIIRTRELTIVRCRGPLVFAGGADLLHTAAAQAFLAGQDVVLDLRHVTQVDAHGAGVLADLCARARHEGRALSLAGANDRVQHVLRVTGLASLVSGHGVSLLTGLRRGPDLPHQWPTSERGEYVGGRL